MMNFRKNFMKISAFTICMMLITLSVFIPVNAEGEESNVTFTPFATAIGKQTVNHGDKYNFIYHTKVKSDTLFDSDGVPTYTSNSNAYYSLALKGWGSTYEGIYISFYIQDKGTEGIQYWFNLNGQWRSISAQTAANIGTTGLDIFIAHIGEKSKAFGVYVGKAENDPTLLYTITASQADHIYEISQAAADGATVTTIGYKTTYTTVTDAANAFNTIANKDVPVTAIVGENVTSDISGGTYRVGDYISFTASAKDGYNTEDGYVLSVTANGEKMTAKDGTYSKIITASEVAGVEFSVSVVKEFDEFATIVGTQTVSHGDKYNFIYHTKVKDAALFDDDGVPTYTSNSNAYYSLALKGWGSTYEGIYISFYIQDKGTEGIQYWFNLNGQWRSISAQTAANIGTTGLDIFIAHIGEKSKAFGVYVGKAENDPTLLYTITASQADHIYEISQAAADGATVTTIGYKTTYTTVTDAANAFNTIANKDVPVTAIVGENVTSDIAGGTYRIGDLIEFTADVAADNVLNVTANGEKLAAKDGTFAKVLTVNDLNGVKFNLSLLEEFEEFASLIGNSEFKHGGKYGKFVYHVNLQSDTLFDSNGVPKYQDMSVPYFSLVLNGWGTGYEAVSFELLIQPKSTGIEYWFKFSDNEYRKLSSDKAKKIGGKSGLNLYVVHNETNPKVFELYSESNNSDNLELIYSLTAAQADHIYEVRQSIKDGGNITTNGYQVNGDYDNKTSATELFWKKGLPATGDINDDGKFDIVDLVRIKKYLASSTTKINKHSADYNNDRELDSLDLTSMRRSLLGNEEELLQFQSPKYINQQLYYDNNFDSKSVKGADPSCMRIEAEGDKNFGKYILTLTGNSTTIDTYIGKDLANWEKRKTLEITNADGTALTDVVKKDVWAPEMIYDGNTEKYYLYFSATPGNKNDVTGMTDDDFAGKFAKLPYVAVSDSYDGPFVITDNSAAYLYADNTRLSENDGDSTNGYAYFLKYSLFNPKAMWEQLEKMAASDTVAAAIVNGGYPKVFSSIDYHPFVDTDGSKYLYFSCTTGEYEVIFGMKMISWTEPDYSTLTRLTNNKTYTLNVTDTATYERNNVNEGAWITKHNDKYYLTMSINSYGKDDYKVIQAVADSPLGSYRKLTVEEGGILLGSDRVEEVSGCGHHSIVENNGELYIVYHTHQDIAEQGSARYIALDKVEWVTNSNGLDVMYVNGPTRKNIMPLPSFASGYSNLVPDAEVTATNVKAGSSISYLSDKLINSRGSTWKYSNTDFGDNYAKNTVFSGESVLTVDFGEKKTVRSIMIYNADDTEIGFDNIEKIRLFCADGTVKCINNLSFDKERNTYTYCDTTTSTSSFYLGAAVAEFNNLDVTKIEITVKPQNNSSSVGINEIVVLGK